MSVRILENRCFSLIAAYARIHGIALCAGQTPEAFARDLYAANVEAMMERYPFLPASEIPPQAELLILNAADGVEVTEAIEMLFYNAEDHLSPSLEQDLVAIIRHVDIGAPVLPQSATRH